MTDERYVYIQDIREKKAIGRGAFAKKCGSKTGYVGLPSDHLTEAQKRRRNGPVQTYNINRIIRDWTTFKALPDDLKKEYMRGCRNNYGAKVAHVAEAMGVKPATLSNHLYTRSIYIGQLGRPKPLSPDWQKFVSGEMNLRGEYILPRVSDILDSTPEVSPDPVVLDAPAPAARPSVTPSRVNFSLEGTTAQLADLVALLTNSTSVYDFELTITAKTVFDMEEIK